MGNWIPRHLPARLRWAIVKLVDSRTDLCWSSAVSYGLQYGPTDFPNLTEGRTRCMNDRMPDGFCDCCKFGPHGRRSKSELKGVGR